MKDRFDKIDDKLNKIEGFLADYRVESEKRLSKLETAQKGFVTVFTIILTAVVTAVINIFNR
jgi:hypothetical protein